MLVLDSKMYLESAYIQAVASLVNVNITFRENGSKFNLKHMRAGYDIKLTNDIDVDDLKILILTSFKMRIPDKEKDLLNQISYSDLTNEDKLKTANIILGYCFSDPMKRIR